MTVLLNTRNLIGYALQPDTLVEVYLSLKKDGDLANRHSEYLRVDFEWYIIRKAADGKLYLLPGSQPVPAELEPPVHSFALFEMCRFKEHFDYGLITNNIRENTQECHTREFASWKVEHPQEEIVIAVKLLGFTSKDSQPLESKRIDDITVQVRAYDPYGTWPQNLSRVFFWIAVLPAFFMLQRSIRESGARQRFSIHLFLKYLCILGIIGHIPLLTSRPSSWFYLIVVDSVLGGLFQGYLGTFFLVMIPTVAVDKTVEHTTQNTTVKKLYLLISLIIFTGFRVTFLQEWGKPTSEREDHTLSLLNLFAWANLILSIYTCLHSVIFLVFSFCQFKHLDKKAKRFLLLTLAYIPCFFAKLLLPLQIQTKVGTFSLLESASLVVFLQALCWMFSAARETNGLKMENSSIASSRGKSGVNTNYLSDQKQTDQYDPSQPNSTEEHSFNPKRVEDSIDNSNFDPEQFDPIAFRPKKTSSNPGSREDGDEGRYGTPNKSTHVTPGKRTELMFKPELHAQVEPPKEEQQDEPGEISYDMENEEIS